MASDHLGSTMGSVISAVVIGLLVLHTHDADDHRTSMHTNTDLEEGQAHSDLLHFAFGDEAGDIQSGLHPSGRMRYRADSRQFFTQVPLLI